MAADTKRTNDRDILFICGLNMDTTRQNKFSRLIQKELAEILQREGKKFCGTSFVTITNVKVTPDLALARISLSVFKEKQPLALIKNMQTHKHEIRKMLGFKIKNQARHIPELEFFLDDSLDYVARIDDIFKTLHIPPADETK
ncbi:MAG: 30S ribosome-binding factor RbfA [Bacteroidia bacterium]